MKSLLLVLAIVCAAAGIAPAQAQDLVTLAYKPLKPGEIIHIHTGTQVVGTITGMGLGNQNMTQKQDQWMKMECLEIDPDGNSLVRMTFERMAITTAVGPMTMTFDSADKSTSQPSALNPIAEPILAMVGKSVTAKIDSQGRCLEVNGFAEMMEAAFKDLPGGKQIAEAFKGMFSDESFKQNFFGKNDWLPRKPVKIGEVWSTELKTPMGPLGKITMKMKCKLLGFETVNGRRCAKVATTSNMEVDNQDKPMTIGGQTMKMHMTSTGGTGSWLWDLDRGRMLQSKEISPMEMTMQTEKPGSQTQPAEGLKISQKMTYSTTTELVDDDSNNLPLKAEATQPVESRLPSDSVAPSSQPAAKP